MTAAAEPVRAAVAPIPPVRLTASTIDDDALDALYAERDMLGRDSDRLRRDWTAMRDRAEQAEAEAQRWLAFIGRGFTTHIQFGVIHPDGTVEQLPCADWCYACRVEQAEDAIARVREVAEQFAVTDGLGAVLGFGEAAECIRTALDGPSEPRTAPTAALVSPVGLRGAQGATGGLG